jgi:hypothetical protein
VQHPLQRGNSDTPTVHPLFTTGPLSLAAWHGDPVDLMLRLTPHGHQPDPGSTATVSYPIHP